MTERASIVATFLRAAGWSDAVRRPLAGDASARRYERLVAHSGATAVLMDAPGAAGAELGRFAQLSEYLRRLGLSAPGVLAEDRENGLMLLEDLGDALFTVVADRNPALEPPIYRAATDLLVELHRHPPPGGLEVLDADRMAELAMLALETYRTALAGPLAPRTAITFRKLLRESFAPHVPMAGVTVLRDFHAGNLIWLPDRAGHARVGLLDFQDALTGHPAYDLVSLLDDARRDVPLSLRAAMLFRYKEASGQDGEAFDAAVAAHATQRHLRIIGVFARLCLRDGKPGYLTFLPRVWGQLMRALAHPTLAPLQVMCHDLLPEPDTKRIGELREKCNLTP